RSTTRPASELGSRSPPAATAIWWSASKARVGVRISELGRIPGGPPRNSCVSRACEFGPGQYTLLHKFGHRVLNRWPCLNEAAMARSATTSKAPSGLPESLLAEIGRRREGMARHMARAVITDVRWDSSTGAPPSAAAIARACAAGLDLFLAAAREARAPTPEELHRVAQLGIHQARGSQAV